VPRLLARLVLAESGWLFSPCGAPRLIGRYRACAISMDVTGRALESVRHVAEARSASAPFLPRSDASAPAPLAAH
jgi:hypothetical protein